LKFENFAADMGPRPKGTSLSRFRDIGNYSPSNCAWHTKAQQLAEAASAKRYAEHKVDILVQQRAHHAEHKTEINAASRENYAEHQVEIRARENEYALNNPEVRSAGDANKTAKRFGCAGTVTGAQLRALYKKCHGRCLCCNKKRRLTPDHVVPLGKGGSNDISNIQPLCLPCNLKKHNRCTDYRIHN
jgi:5-methylcytosine-specific restriction endonuclease McrA